MDTNLVTQALVSGFQTLIADSEATFNGLSSSLVSLTQQLTAAINTMAADRRAEFAAHVNASVSPSEAEPAHSGLSYAAGEYKDSAGDVVGNVLVTVTIGGTTYQLPAAATPWGVCHAHNSGGGGGGCCVVRI